ncbi:MULTISPECIES: phage/plasmid primase, P4 family [Rhodococcus]|uniref:Phage/plasmid primase, P4 family n=1 Tax=Rhodococcus oxybenzonivorans TaxID=1990687 RepID=A0AAE5A8S8_9NOCA|nr:MULTISPECIES: phage/plasmid primase, P4 family [Rhodococcus]MDV7246763.1 phage/plasmid primase, P4 family [Rhodococcus oxybenzonivorans]MDV7267084.1 phage/plasmid primase, P4 family [Rhodococcus oxybenzonivorans]MDV7278353.1 phage/plasmid primase, P4 family [Rhodococcus oxybenzonivorans]MDV7337777.1 phage/plasmid primase, P4 family [Rhodococcus oxybenzonivorans]MDV7346721.1 phage/plasmid primase, P4 family [Rhodococcus oxybenzonivorans]
MDESDAQHAKAQMEAEAATHWPSPNEPTKVARKLVERKAFGGGSPLFWQDDWMTWTGAHWSRVARNDVSSDLRKILEDGLYLKSGSGDSGLEQVPVPWNPNRKNLGEALDALRDISLVKSGTLVPAWISSDGAAVSDHPLGAPGNWIAFSNGLFNWRTRELVPCVREFFNESSLPFAYDPDAPEPDLWLRCLDQWFPEDAEAIQLLQEWFGYVISGRLDLEAALYIQGIPGSGKTTVRKVLEKLVGKANVVSMSTSDLNNDNFGLEKAIGKTLIVFPEATFGRNAKAAVEKFKEIASGEFGSVRRKHRIDWEGVLPGRMMFTSNHAPDFRDNSGAPLDRLYALAMNQKFRGTDAMSSTLEHDLNKEVSGILNWALDGLACLSTRGRFVQPASGREVLEDAAELGSPMGAFVRDCCDVGNGFRLSTERLYDEYERFVGRNGKPLGKAKFGAELRSYMKGAYPDVAFDRKKRGVDGRPAYEGLALKSRTVHLPRDQGDGGAEARKASDRA